MEGTDRAVAEREEAQKDLEKKQEQYNSRMEGLDAAQSALKSASDELAASRAKVKELEKNGPSPELELAKRDVADKYNAYMTAQHAVDNYDASGLQQAAEAVTEARNKLAELDRRVAESRADDAEKELKERRSREDSGLDTRYAGIGSDEGRAGESRARYEQLQARLDGNPLLSVTRTKSSTACEALGARAPPGSSPGPSLPVLLSVPGRCQVLSPRSCHACLLLRGASPAHLSSRNPCPCPPYLIVPCPPYLIIPRHH